ncbi:MAG: hypothetical protein AAB865_03035 [Patescibacteria group bacterium]
MMAFHYPVGVTLIWDLSMPDVEQALPWLLGRFGEGPFVVFAARYVYRCVLCAAEGEERHSADCRGIADGRWVEQVAVLATPIWIDAERLCLAV